MVKLTCKLLDLHLSLVELVLGVIQPTSDHVITALKEQVTNWKDEDAPIRRLEPEADRRSCSQLRELGSVG